MPPTQHHVLLRGAVAFFLPLFGSHFSPFSLHLYFISPTSEGQLFAGILPSQGQPEPGCRSNILDGRRMPHTHRRGEVSPTAPCVGLDGEKKKNCRDLLSQQASLLPRHYVLKIFQLMSNQTTQDYYAVAFQLQLAWLHLRQPKGSKLIHLSNILLTRRED